MKNVENIYQKDGIFRKTILDFLGFWNNQLFEARLASGEDH